jgi:hypothetical protein
VLRGRSLLLLFALGLFPSCGLSGTALSFPIFACEFLFRKQCGFSTSFLLENLHGQTTTKKKEVQRECVRKLRRVKWMDGVE